MTKEEAELWIKRLEGGNSDDAYRPSTNLSIVLRLMLHSHIKMAVVCNLTVGDYRRREYISTKNAEYVYSYEVTEEDDEIVEKHIRKKNLGDEDMLIQVSSRALRQKFQNMVSVYYTGGRRPEIGDFFYAGLGIENNKSMRRNQSQNQ